MADKNDMAEISKVLSDAISKAGGGLALFGLVNHEERAKQLREALAVEELKSAFIVTEDQDEKTEFTRDALLKLLAQAEEGKGGGPLTKLGWVFTCDGITASETGQTSAKLLLFAFTILNRLICKHMLDGEEPSDNHLYSQAWKLYQSLGDMLFFEKQYKKGEFEGFSSMQIRHNPGFERNED